MRFTWECFHPQSCKLSPFLDGSTQHIAVASAQFFGVAGNGAVSVLSTRLDSGEAAAADDAFVLTQRWETLDGCFDAAWIEAQPHLLAAAAGDGSCYVFRVATDLPIARIRAHDRECVCVASSSAATNLLATCSWDACIRVWDLNHTPPRACATDAQSSVRCHAGAAHAAEWHPSHAAALASVGADGRLVLSDIRVPGPSVTAGIVSTGDVLTLDWNKYRQTEVLCGTADGALSLWDVRSLACPLLLQHACRMPIRRVRACPFRGHTFFAAAYDMTVTCWSTAADSSSGALELKCVRRFTHHNEFVSGVDCSLHTAGSLVSCGWDQAVCAWNGDCDAEPAPPSLPPTPPSLRAQWPVFGRPFMLQNPDSVASR